MYALRERRVHVTQEDFEMAVAKVIGPPPVITRSNSIKPGSQYDAGTYVASVVSSLVYNMTLELT